MVLAFVAALLAVSVPVAHAELTERGDLFVRFKGGIAPNALPRTQLAPIAVSVAGTVKTLSGERPPPLRQIRIELNRGGRLDPRGLPVCRYDQLVAASPRQALAALRGRAGRRRRLPSPRPPSPNRRPSPRRGTSSPSTPSTRAQRDPRPRLRPRSGADHPHHRLPHPPHRRHLRHRPHRRAARCGQPLRLRRRHRPAAVSPLRRPRQPAQLPQRRLRRPGGLSRAPSSPSPAPR